MQPPCTRTLFVPAKTAQDPRRRVLLPIARVSCVLCVHAGGSNLQLPVALLSLIVVLMMCGQCCYPPCSMSTFDELFGDCLESAAPSKQRSRKSTRNDDASSDGSDGNGSDSSDGNGSDRSDESDTDDPGASGDRRSVDHPSYTQPARCMPCIELHSNYQPLWSTLLGCWVSLLSQVPAAVANCGSRITTHTCSHSGMVLGSGLCAKGTSRGRSE